MAIPGRVVCARSPGNHGHQVSDETFGRAKQILGEQQVVDLTTVAGTYITVAMLLAMAVEGVPPGKELPFKPGEP